MKLKPLCFRAALIVTLFVCNLHGDTYDQLKERYLKLRNTDSSISKLEEWQKLDEEIVASFSKFNEVQATELLFKSSILLEDIYKKNNQKEYITLSKERLQNIFQKYPSSLLADDALLRLAKLEESEEEAKKYLFKVINEYPEGDQVEAAEMLVYGVVKSSDKNFTKLKERLVVLDPGHGGDDFGAVGVAGLLEKDVVFDVARRVYQKFSEHKKIQVFLTRNHDEFVPLERRAEITNKSLADLFISLHANSSPKGTLSGWEIYKGGAIFDDLIGNKDHSNKFANILSKNFSKVSSIKKLGVKHSPFYVLDNTNMPGVLVELGFIDNVNDGKLLSSENFRENIANSLSDAIKQYF